jgi:4-hydroxy-tetrahydrodipicolinate synthase
MLDHIKGVYIIAQTPFGEDGALDLDSIDTLTDFYFRHQADGLTVLGVSGESGKLGVDEALSVAGRFIERAQGHPVIVGVSNPSLAALAELTAKVMDRGAAGVMIAPPGGTRTEEELFGYFDAVFRRIGNVPTVLQDFPFSTGVWMSVPSMLRLIEAFPQIQVVKAEDIPSPAKISRLRAAPGRRVAILTGNNALYLPTEMDHGADGPMAGFSHPEMLSEVYRLHVSGQREAARDVFDRYLPLLNYEGQGFWGVAARKEVLRRRGAIRSAAMRQPGPRLTPEDISDIDLLLERLGRSLAEAGKRATAA